MRKGMWSPEEDAKLKQFISKHGYHCWNEVPKKTGLQRCGKSCRLRWINYLRPGLRKSKFSSEEKKLIIELHEIYGNRWTKIAKHLEGRTDNDVKNLWHSQMRMHIGKQKSQKLIIPNEHAHVSSTLCSISTNPIKDEKGLTSANEVTMRPRSMEKVFPFILDPESYNIGNSSKHNHGQQCPPLNHIEKSLSLLDISESSMHSFGVEKNCPMESSISSSFISSNYSSLQLELESGPESKMHFSHLVEDNNLMNFSCLLELDVNQEESMLNVMLENLDNMFDDSYIDSHGVKKYHDEDENDESLKHVLPWYYNQQSCSEFMDPNGILENMIDDEGASYSLCFSNQVLDNSVQYPPLLDSFFVS